MWADRSLTTVLLGQLVFKWTLLTVLRGLSNAKPNKHSHIYGLSVTAVQCSAEEKVQNEKYRVRGQYLTINYRWIV